MASHIGSIIPFFPDKSTFRGLMTAKIVIEATDNENKPITYNIIEGDVKELYKTFKFRLDQVNKAVDGTSFVKWKKVIMQF
ncbi:hypothetical protein RJ639_043364 [Escallonia herrerae]|uniref:Bet v I/Major latex protein domain-containing protein n=1 Tax=Escallonia herrerae TaxID=1293975 RepID=A0AA89B8P9_9ASTE|nr:hypothetical protein RJ639_043364 [Escallonia herrerae]